MIQRYLSRVTMWYPIPRGHLKICPMVRTMHRSTNYSINVVTIGVAEPRRTKAAFIHYG